MFSWMQWANVNYEGGPITIGFSFPTLAWKLLWPRFSHKRKTCQKMETDAGNSCEHHMKVRKIDRHTCRGVRRNHNSSTANDWREQLSWSVGGDRHSTNRRRCYSPRRDSFSVKGSWFFSGFVCFSWAITRVGELGERGSNILSCIIFFFKKWTNFRHSRLNANELRLSGTAAK